MVIPIVLSVLGVSLSTFVQFARLFKNNVLLRRVIAAVILFALPGIYLLVSDNDIDIGVYLTNPGLTLLSILVFSAIAVAINKYSEADTRFYPQLRVAHWTPRVFAINTLTWILYLLAYEFLFRGFLFYHCLEVFPLWQACSINVVIYAAYHLPKGVKETLLCIPFGVLLCVLTAYTGNIWSAVVIHIALALSNEYYAVETILRKKQSDYVFRSE